MNEYEWIDKAEFDGFCRRKEFEEGPNIDDFGSGYGDPYNPSRRIWGTLKGGRKVESNLTNERPTQ